MKLKLHTQIFLAIALGITSGIIFKDITPTYIAPFGVMFMRLLKLMVLPLVFTSVTLGIVSIGDSKNLGSISFKTFTYFVVTGVISSILGLILVNNFKPGIGTGISTENLSSTVQEPPALSEIFVNIAPQNIFESLANGEILPVIVFAIMLGVALTQIKEKGKPIVEFFDSSCSAIMVITNWIIALTPIGVFALSANVVATLGLKSLISVGAYFGTAVFGMTIHAVVILPIILRVFGNYSAVELFKKVLPSLAIATPTASSAAAFPVTMECLNKAVGVPKKITSFVISLGTTMNMDGTAIYQSIAVMFIAQLYGIDLGLGHQAVIVLTALLASVGAAALPGAGIVTMVMILNAVGVPVEGIGIILAVDRILDSVRTPVNVWSNMCGALIVANMEGERLIPHDMTPGKDGPEIIITEREAEATSKFDRHAAYKKEDTSREEIVTP